MRQWLTLWVASLLIVAALVSGIAIAQTRESRVVSGSDIGFRVEGRNQAGEPIGTWVIRVNGEWVPVAPKPSLRPTGQ
jgi:hypothetical protein